MTSLRMRVVEAMAVNDHPDLLRVAEDHLDRLLDCLTENADEWESEAFGDSLRELSLARKLTIEALLAVLREDR